MSFTQKILDRLHDPKKRKKLIDNAMEDFYQRNGYWDEELRKKLEKEADRIYPMVDESIAKERIKRTKKTFLIVGGLGLLFVGLTILTGGATLTTLALLTPFVTAGISAFASMKTLKTSYFARIKGAMKSVVATHEKELEEKKNLERTRVTESPALSQQQAPEARRDAIPASEKVLDRLKNVENQLSFVQKCLNRNMVQSQGWAVGVA